MRSPAAQILETALALQRAPGERFRLRDRPLPDGLVHVLEVASGSPQALAGAAAELNESPDTLLEAARFYLEQVLFAAPDADAYRILGVPRDAPAEVIRTHHRWLQRWLHPDRALAGDASVYATRVNQAWAMLRTPESRHQYDVRLAEARLAGATAPLPAATVRHWEHDEPEPIYGRRSRWLLAAALAACAVLAVLVVRHEQGPQPWSPDDDVAVAAAGEQAPIDQPAIEDRDLGILTEALAAVPAPAEPSNGRVPEPTEAPAVEPLPVRLPTTRPDPAPDTLRVEEAQAAAPSGSAPAPIRPARRPTPAGTPISSTTRVAAATPVVAPIPVAARAAPMTAPPAAPPPPDDTTLLLTRMQLAQSRFAELTAYLAAQPGAAPPWSDSDSQTAADRVRDRMAVHGILQFDPPNWRVQMDNARLNVDYRCNKCAVRKGRLDVQLVWREGLWQVRGIDLAPAA